VDSDSDSDRVDSDSDSSRVVLDSDSDPKDSNLEPEDWDSKGQRGAYVFKILRTKNEQSVQSHAVRQFYCAAQI